MKYQNLQAEFKGRQSQRLRVNFIGLKDLI